MSCSVLIVCEGNLARSPFASALLEQRWPTHRMGPATFESAGIRAAPDEPATEQIRAIAEPLGLDLEHHRSRPLTPELLRDSDLVLAMTEQQRQEAQRLLPEATSRIFTVIEFVRLLRGLSEIGSDLRDVVASAHASRPYSLGADQREDIEDPYGHGNGVYRRVATDLTDRVRSLSDLLAGETGHPSPARLQTHDRRSEQSRGLGFWQLLLRRFRRTPRPSRGHGGPAQDAVGPRRRRLRRRR